MIFSRGKAKQENFELGKIRQVEAATLKRWQTIASRAREGIEEEYAVEPDDDRYSAEWQTAEPEVVEKEKPAVEAAPQVKAAAPAASVKSSVLPSDLTLPFEEDLKRRFGANIKSALGPGTVIEGTFKFDSPVCIEGTLKGEVSSSSALIVGDRATVEARVKVGSLIVLGEVTGDIEASELIEIRAGGQLNGDILTKRLVLEDGGVFNGNCNMLD